MDGMTIVGDDDHSSTASSLSLVQPSSSSLAKEEDESRSSNDDDDDDSSFSSCSSSSSSFFGSETTLDIISIQSSNSPAAAPTRLFNIILVDDDDDDSSSCSSSAYSTSSSTSSGSRITRTDSWVVTARFVPSCHFVAMSDLVNIPCGAQGSITTEMLNRDDKNHCPPPHQPHVPETVQIDALLSNEDPLALDMIDGKVKEPAASNAETTTGLVPLADFYKKRNNKVVLASTQPLNSKPARVSSSAKQNQQAATLLDFLGLSSDDAEDAEDVPAALPAFPKRQVPAPSISYNNKKMGLVAVSNATAVINAPTIPGFGERSRSRQVHSARTHRTSRVPPPPIGYGMFTLVEEHQPQTRKEGEVVPKTGKTPPANVSSTSAAGCFRSDALSRSPLSCNKSVRWSDATGSPLLSSSAVVSPISDSEPQLRRVIKSDSADATNPKKTEAEPVTLSESAMNSCMANNDVTGEARGVRTDGQQAVMAGVSAYANDVANVMEIPATSVSNTPTEMTESDATVPEKVNPNITTAGLPVNRSATRMTKSSTMKSAQKAPTVTNDTVPKMTKAKKHTTSKVSSLIKTRVVASKTSMQRATDPTNGDRAPLTISALMPSSWIPAKPLSAPLIPATPNKKSTAYKLQSRSPTFPVAAQE